MTDGHAPVRGVRETGLRGALAASAVPVEHPPKDEAGAEARKGAGPELEGHAVSSWSMALWTRRTLEHYQPDTDGPLDEWLASWAAQGLVPEYPWDSPPIVVNGRKVVPYALVDAAWQAEHPEYMAALQEARGTQGTP